MFQERHQEDGEEYALTLNEIESEFKHYNEVFKNKVVMLDCAYPDIPNFWFYFSRKFDFLGLRRLIVPVYETMTPAYLLELERDINADGTIDQDDTTISILHGADHIDDTEKQRLYNSADIVIICRSFNKMEDYVQRMESLGKDWIAIGGNLAILSKPMFNRFKAGKMFLGVNETANKKFEDRNGEEKPVASLWYTSLQIPKYIEPLLLTKKYEDGDYPKHDNYDAIECGKVDDIPCDYDGVIAVPPTFFYKWNPDQFDIIGTLSSPKAEGYNYGAPVVNGKKKFGRLLIQKKGREHNENHL